MCLKVFCQIEGLSPTNWALLIKSQSIKLSPKEQITGITIKINVPTNAGKTNTHPINVWLCDRLLNSFDKNFFIFVLYYKGEE